MKTTTSPIGFYINSRLRAGCVMSEPSNLSTKQECEDECYKNSLCELGFENMDWLDLSANDKALFLNGYNRCLPACKNKSNTLEGNRIGLVKDPMVI